MLLRTAMPCHASCQVEAQSSRKVESHQRPSLAPGAMELALVVTDSSGRQLQKAECDKLKEGDDMFHWRMQIRHGSRHHSSVSLERMQISCDCKLRDRLQLNMCIPKLNPTRQRQPLAPTRQRQPLAPCTWIKKRRLKMKRCCKSSRRTRLFRGSRV